MIVNNVKEFIAARDCGEETMAEVSRNVYKYTDCGAWITFWDDCIDIGSIVEGCDYGTDTYTLTYPFEIKEFWDALKAVEDEADSIWESTHGCEDCGLNGAINLECKTCEGEGVIL